MSCNFLDGAERQSCEQSFRLSWRSLAVAVACLGLLSQAAYAKVDPNSPLTTEQQRSLKKAAAFAKKGRGDKASPIFNDILATCTDLPKCIAVAGYTEQYGHSTVDARRAIMARALELCRTYDDYILVAMKSRQYECFDVTRTAIQQLVSVANTKEQLTDLARKAMEVSMTDVAHLAMEKEYTIVKTVPDALEYANEVSLMGFTDLQRKVVKELIDDESNCAQLCMILRKIEPFKLKDLNRYLLKKALDQAASVDDFSTIWEAARRHNQKDIFDVAAFRGKKMQLMQRIKGDRANHAQRIEEWKQGQDSAQDKVQKDMGGGQPVTGF
jgi:hypothetical protein